MNDRLESLWKYYEEHASQAKQHEDQRERMTALLIVLAGVMVGFLTADKLDVCFRIFGSVMLFVIGLFGLMFSLKHYERNRLHTAILGKIRAEIDREITHPYRRDKKSLDALRKEGETKHYTEYPASQNDLQKNATSVLAKHRTFYYWATVPLIVAFIGFAGIILELRFFDSHIFSCLKKKEDGSKIQTCLLSEIFPADDGIG
jgi:hypothetical protein